MEPINLSRQFLIAMPAMADPIFAKSLIFVCDHNEQGAMGVIVNRPLGMDMKTLFQQVDIELRRQELAEQPVYFGGPVQTDRGFVLHQPLGNWQSTMAVEDDLGLTTSKDVLLAVGEGGGPDRMFVSLGYAGWEAGQLEGEMSQNAWLTVDADIEVIFGLPAEQRYEAAIKLLGIDMAMLSDTAGHA
ncbi:YqgE/AlgH family protein [Chitinimonas koreensis]|uniref:YqgE/AlgH family protein n=1 Tax=Chitinimonas koreensis TaxID=356302 RepID=UPI000408DAC9|nr:YqgE/AlgH family protein [Chitinimonas koreensis]QNM96683.1 YqgE/AlgH family protein [Chitinimonas koreensis]